MVFSHDLLMNFSIFSSDWLMNFLIFFCDWIEVIGDICFWQIFSTVDYISWFSPSQQTNFTIFSCDQLMNFLIFLIFPPSIDGQLSLFFLPTNTRISQFFSYSIGKNCIFFPQLIDKFRDIFQWSTDKF